MNFKKEPIYKNREIDMNVVKKVIPLMESTFNEPLKGFTGLRESIKKDRLKFAAMQYVNRGRVARNLGMDTLNEDGKIFGNVLGDGVKKLFENASTPANIVSMGNIQSPGNPTTTPGGIWGAGYQPGSGDIPSYVFGLQTQLALHCQSFDFLPTIAVDTPKVILNFVDTVYGGGELDGIEDYPTILEFASKYFTHTNVKKLGLKRSSSKVVLWDGETNNGNALEVLFYVTSLEKPAINAEILNFGSSDDGVTITKNSTVSLVDVATAFNESLKTPGKAKVLVNGTAATDPKKGEEVTINFVSATRTNIAEAATNDNSEGGMSRQQHRKGPKHKLNIVSLDKELHIGGIEIDADTDNIQIKDLAAQGVSVIARLYAGVQNQLIQNLDEYIMNHLYRLGVEHAVSAYQSQGINHSIYIASPGKVSINMTDIDVVFEDAKKKDRRADMGAIINQLKSAGYENQTTHASRLFARMLKVCEFVGYQNREKTPDYMLLGGELAAAVKSHSTYSVCPIASTLSEKAEIYYSGSVFGDVAVYKNPRIAFNDPRILFGVRGDDTDSGAKFLAYDLAASRQTIAEGTMAEKIRAWSRFEIADVGFYPEMKYYTMVAINEYDWN